MNTKQFNLLHVLSTQEEEGVCKNFIDNWNGTNAYICDAISQEAHGLIDIYTASLYENAWTFESYNNDALSEFGWEGCGEEITRVFQMGQYLYYQELLYANIQEILFNLGLYIQENEKPDMTDEEQSAFEEALEDLVANTDQDDRFSQFEDKVKALLA